MHHFISKIYEFFLVFYQEKIQNCKWNPHKIKKWSYLSALQLRVGGVENCPNNTGQDWQH